MPYTNQKSFFEFQKSPVQEKIAMFMNNANNQDPKQLGELEYGRYEWKLIFSFAPVKTAFHGACELVYYMWFTPKLTSHSPRLVACT